MVWEADGGDVRFWRRKPKSLIVVVDGSRIGVYDNLVTATKAVKYLQRGCAEEPPCVTPQVYYSMFLNDKPINDYVKGGWQW